MLSLKLTNPRMMLNKNINTHASNLPGRQDGYYTGELKQS
jgi:hypothetical protein